ncbi:hypothetical protein SSX86_005023 [Deinandra increscens subsp. villosa]|uniref:SKI-interacting protein SKIP SNW domain-containing protein n=1 Tax=Deinandra increscens subsp. villosa TaxID=3103831 RepID=A0AAP0DT21_9ASTR
MAALKEVLPPVKPSATIFYDHSPDPWFKQRYSSEKAGQKTFDAIVRQDENAKRIVYSQHRDLVPKILKDEDEDHDQQEHEDAADKQQEIEETARKTKAFLKERIIRMVEMPVDPLEPPKFKHKRIPKANGSPPVPLMHSPPRPVTVKDQKDWKIPPCISNWKNPKGYTIPLDKRLAADGRGLQEVQISDRFAQLSEALYVAEQQAREAESMRSKVLNEMMLKEKERKEQELRVLAQKARSERTCTGPAVYADTDEPTRREHEERVRREKIREERRMERRRERRLEAKDAVAMGKKRKITRDQDRDISEKAALGMASSAGSARGGEVKYDQRLFNQEKGMDSGFATDDQYIVYDKGLFSAQPTLSTLYRPKKDVPDDEMNGKAYEKTGRFKPDKEFTGAGEKRRGPRGRPVEFEMEVAEEADPFGLDQFITRVKGAHKK